MARWTETWLSGPAAAGVDMGPRGRWRGEVFGLPADGPGALAGWGRRLAAFGLDLLVGALIGGLINALVADPTEGQRVIAVNGAFALQVLVLTALTGQSIGMRLLGVRVQKLAGGGVPGFLPAAIRTALLLLLVPAVISDREGRGLHDKAAGTVVVRA
ncbi:MAG: RDD family protein [Actinobacteria bacterium]|nr:RDD family protein [Actinomycetota bacterium]MBW3646266.1 RDD family protein [Actinomycetota bacterium]